MEWKDIISVLAGGLVILVVALVVKPALFPGSDASSVPGAAPPAYVPPVLPPAPTPFPGDGAAYTRTFRWTGIDGGVRMTEVRVPEALFLERRATPRFADPLAWGRYALADADRPVLEDLARRIAPPVANPEEEYFRLMDLIFFVQQIPYAPDNSTGSYTEGVLPQYAVSRGADVEYPRYPVETLVDGKGDSEDAAILMAGLLDALGYDAVLLNYADHTAPGIRMEGFNPYYAKYTPKYFAYEGKHYYYVEGTNYTTISTGNATFLAKPAPIGNILSGSPESVRSGTPAIIPLRYTIAPAEYRIRPAPLPAGGV